VAHLHLPQQTPEKIESELAGVENTVASIFGPGGPKMTLFRAPYGEPYTSPGSAGFNKVAPIGAKHGVHIGWAIDTLDWEKGSADAVYSSFTGLVKTPGAGAYGVVLMHSIHPQTAGALPRIIDYIKANKFELRQVEDVVRARYGKSSAEILGVATPGTGGSGGATGGASGISDAGAGTGGAGGGGATGGSTGTGGSTSTGGSTGTGGSTSTGGSTGTGGKATGGSSGGSAGATGTGGDGEEETGGSTGGTHKGASGGCTYGGGSPAAFWAISLALLLARRRRRS
jgi:MYXO-CTERM domain-containing protein